MKKLFSLFTLVFFLFSSCNKDDYKMENVKQNNEKKVTIQMGVWGTVSFREGNCMPGNDKNCKEQPVIRLVKIYQKTRIADVINYNREEPTFYPQFSTTLVKEVQSDAEGFFQVGLPEGEYTLVVEEKGKLYTNLFTGTGSDMFINVFAVENGKAINKNFLIDYKAAY